MATSIIGGAVRTYRLKKLLILIFFIAYTVLQGAGLFLSSRGEYFPVFSWSLFSAVINPVTALEIEILAIGEQRFPEAINFFELGDRFPEARARSNNVMKSAMRVLHLYRDDPAAGEEARRMFERSYLGGNGAVEYRLVVLYFDPVRRWRTGEVIERRVVARFRAEPSR